MTAGPDDLVQTARRLHAEAAANAPEVQLSQAVFVDRVLQLVADKPDPAAALAAIHAADLFVAHAAVRGDDPAVVEIDRRLRIQAAAVVRSLGESQGFADDLESDLREHVLSPRAGTGPRLAAYSGTGPLDGWLRVTIMREALRARRRAARDGSEEHLVGLPGVVTPELDYLKAAYHAHFRVAFRGAMKQLDDRQRNLIRLHYGDGVGVESLGQMYRVHFSTISRWISAARKQLFEHTRLELRSQLGVKDAEVDEIMDLVRSRLDVTISLFARSDS